MSRVAVVGAGTMGAGIALAAARAGFDVALIEIDPAARARALERLARDARRLQDEPAMNRIAWPGSIDDLPPCDLAIEAVPEDLALKSRVLTALARTGSGCVLATNTSSLSVTDLAVSIGDDAATRLIGLHFFNPPTVMKLVEIIPTDATRSDVTEAARAFVERLGKTAVLAKDTPGFIVNRVARPYYLQALRALEREVGDAEMLDRVARGVGFRMGPFELMDLIGLDVNLATSESIFQRTHAKRLAPSALQQAMVRQGRLGRKSGAGFYDYAGGAAPQAPMHEENNPEIDEAAPRDEDERIAIVGFGGFAEELHEELSRRYAQVVRVDNDDAIDELPLDTTALFDVGDGANDRAHQIKEYDNLFPPETVLFADAYVTDVEKLSPRLRNPERLVGYGVLSSLSRQHVVEIADLDATSDDAMELAQELFGALQKTVAPIGPGPGLFLGRTVAAIVNEGVYAVQDGIATAADVDVAMRLGTNYPLGPIEWGREIGAARISAILERVAQEDGPDFGPARALRFLDLDDAGLPDGATAL
ncbi:MAG: hypothetical protein JOZ38_10960 [Candidatus Eremiobacteraeota bacterium]|nr:hypothetical protein [Candidatus Eremiobacteraeota bacterium]